MTISSKSPWRPSNGRDPRGREGGGREGSCPVQLQLSILISLAPGKFQAACQIHII